MTIVILRIILRRKQAKINTKSLKIFSEIFFVIKKISASSYFHCLAFFSQFLVRKELKKNSQSFYQFPIFEFN
ncbi:hypothetical protein SAMN05421847_2225 [Halpernia humi]|uniref:Uncharacterized protein n=1 Tax=Halpernia humi TaxID=493375 RepID=A0A1H5ZVV5_9FLAO|nr:hypothetical protein SAMN05421847_2225 [Halpernia humi]